MSVKQITSRDNPFFKELLKLSSSARHRGKSGQTLLDGAHLLSAYLASGKLPLHIITSEAAGQNTEISSLLKLAPAVPVTRLDHALFAELSELKTSSGVLALIGIPQSGIAPLSFQFCLFLEYIQDPGNMGSMLRSAAAAGCEAVYLSKGCADAWSPRVLRAAMGGHFVLNIYEDADLIGAAKLFDGRIFAAAPGAKNSLYESKLTGRIAFAIGNEGSGLSNELMSKAIAVAIPMPGKVESLNAAAATAICLFEAVRQRNLSN